MNRTRLLALAVVPLAVVAIIGATSPAGGTAADGGGYWIVLASDRDGTDRGYSMRPGGDHLSPLGSSRPAFTPVAVSRDGTTIAYTKSTALISHSLYVSRANGTGLHRVVAKGEDPALSPDGKLLAFKRRKGDCCNTTIWTVRTDGHGLRRVSSGPRDEQPDWSPDGTRLVFSDRNRAIVVRSLDGSRRILARGPLSFFDPKWSPNGRWIAYRHYEGAGNRRNGLFAVRPDGSRRHRVARTRDAQKFAWSPDSRKLALSDFSKDDVRHLTVVGVDGRGLKQLRLDVVPASFPRAPLAWSPSGRQLIFAGHVGDDPDQIWVVASDGRGLHRVTNAGSNTVVGLTRRAPARRPAPPLAPSERVTSDRTVTTRAPIADISADGNRVAFLVRSSQADCGHPVLWSAGTRALSRSRLLGPCTEYGADSVYDIELAGSRMVWASFGACGNFCDAALKTATVGHARTQVVSYNYGVVNSGDLKLPDYRLRGDGDLLVFDDGFSKPPRLMRLGTGREKCGESPCTTLRRDKHALPVDSVSAGLIAVREPDQVAIVDAQGALVRVFPFAPDEVSAARLDGGRLTVARLALLDVYDVATGTRQLSRPLPSGYTLADMDGGIALLRRADTIRLLRLSDGASHTLAPGHDVVADLEASGLFYAYKAGTGGRLTFISRAALVQQFN